MLPVNFNGKSGGRDTYRVTEENNREAGVMKGGQDVIYTDNRGSAEIGRNSVGKDLHRTNTGDGSTVGDNAADIQGLRKGDKLLGGRKT